MVNKGVVDCEHLRDPITLESYSFVRELDFLSINLHRIKRSKEVHREGRNSDQEDKRTREQENKRTREY